MAVSIIESVLTSALLWSGFALLVAVAVVPPWLTGDWTVMVPWTLLLIATVAVLVRALGMSFEIADASRS